MQSIHKAIAECDMDSLNSEPKSRLQVQIVFDVLHLQPPNNSASGRITRKPVYFALYRVFEDEMNGKDIETALDVLMLLASAHQTKQDTKLMHFITKNAHWHVYGEFASDESTHMRCLNVFFDVGYFQSSLDLRWCVSFICRQNKLIWLESFLSRLEVLNSDWHVFNLIRDSIQRDDSLEVLALLLRILKPRRDLHAVCDRYEPNNEYTERETLLHVFVKSNLPDLGRLQLLMMSQDPCFLNLYNKRPLRILESRCSFFTVNKHTLPLQFRQSLATMQESEKIHEPINRDFILALALLPGSSSPLRLLDGELLRVIAISARLDYHAPGHVVDDAEEF
jgi:hypothetical protein